jgi:hypothetical protein
MSKTNPEAPGATPDSSYTPHEHEEFKTLVRKGREQLRIRLATGHEVRANPPQPTR